MYDVSCVWMLSGLADGCGSRPLLFIFEDKNLNFKARGAVDWLASSSRDSLWRVRAFMYFLQCSTGLLSHNTGQRTWGWPTRLLYGKNAVNNNTGHRKVQLKYESTGRGPSYTTSRRHAVWFSFLFVFIPSFLFQFRSRSYQKVSFLFLFYSSSLNNFSSYSRSR